MRIVSIIRSQSPLYFQFELDFVEENFRCIPMIVRFNLDAAGIKLKLNEWSMFNVEEREQLAELPVATRDDAGRYRSIVEQLVYRYTGEKATSLNVDPEPVWSVTRYFPKAILETVNQLNLDITLAQWRQLSDLQRFALVKLLRPGHEHKNLNKALIEFGLQK